MVLSPDIRQGGLTTHGRSIQRALTPVAMLESFAGVPLAGVVVTDIDSDHGNLDAQVGLISGLAAQTRHRVIASGHADGLDDLSRVAYVPGIAGAVMGRALMRKRFALEDALALARPGAEEKAAFPGRRRDGARASRVAPPAVPQRGTPDRAAVRRPAL